MCSTEKKKESSGMDGLNPTTKDIFSWLLYSSENIVAPSHGSMSVKDKTQIQKSDHTNLRSSSMDLFHTATPEHASSSPILLSDPLSPRNLQENEPLMSSIETFSSKLHILQAQASDLTHMEESKQVDFNSIKKRIANDMSSGRSIDRISTTPNLDSDHVPVFSGSARSTTPKVSTNLLKKQKLERNRESARECRRRKREHMLSVEEQCRRLERENMELRGQLKVR
jgi:hypothetical protein